MEKKQLTLIIALIVVGAVVLYFLPNLGITPTNETSAPSPEPTAFSQEEEQAAPSSQTGEEDVAPTQEAPAPASNSNAASQAHNEVVVRVEGGNFFFRPNRIEVPLGATVRIVFHNIEGKHDWVIDEFQARTPVISTGETAEVTFVADKAGTFSYYCSVGNHRAMGMEGTLVVLPQEG